MAEIDNINDLDPITTAEIVEKARDDLQQLFLNAGNNTLGTAILLAYFDQAALGILSGYVGERGEAVKLLAGRVTDLASIIDNSEGEDNVH